MKQMLLTLVLLSAASAVRADCFVEYKAKMDNPLRLHYGILALPGGCPGDPSDATRARLASAGWTLLTVLGASPEQPDAQKEANAGVHFLRY